MILGFLFGIVYTVGAIITIAHSSEELLEELNLLVAVLWLVFWVPITIGYIIRRQIDANTNKANQ